ncbi:MAG: histidine phosphatase family protein [Bacteroidetes bacterium]|nr:histidine phosphatase family protein [Bacteroidota bacterium]
MKTFVLCRHAKSDWPYGVADIERPLKERGIKDANFLGNLLSEQSFKPDLVVSSPANRAHSTAKIIAGKLGYKEGKINIEKSIYFEGTEGLIQTIHSLPETSKTVMLFGHNPTMEDAVRTLLGSEAAFEMPTCGMACFESNVYYWKDIDSRNLILRWYLIPRFNRQNPFG